MVLGFSASIRKKENGSSIISLDIDEHSFSIFVVVMKGQRSKRQL